MKAFHLLMFLILVAAGFAQTRIDLQNQGQNVNFVSMSSTRPVKTGATLPSTCLAHELFLKTVASGRAMLYSCGLDGAWGGVGEPTSTQTVTAASTLPATEKVLLLSASSAVTLTTAPQMSAGVDGQRVLVANVGAANITLQDQAVLSGSGMNFGGANLAIASGASVELIYVASQSVWRQAGCANCTTAGATLTANRLLVGSGNRAILATSGVLDTAGALSGLSEVQVGDGTAAGEVRIYETATNGSEYRSWMAPSALSSTLRLQFSDQTPTAGQVLTASVPDSNGISTVTFTDRLTDPGSNGLVKRTAVNMTAAATAGTDYYAPGTAVASTDLPNPTTTAGGKVKALTCADGYYLNGIGSDATPNCVAGVAGTGNGSVTSVGLALPAEFSVSGSPVTVTGTLTGAWASQIANRVLAAPSGASGTPSFRALAAADLPSHTHAASDLTNGTTGSGAAVLATSPAIVTPTIASFTNANHTHTDAAGGGTLSGAAIASGTIATARLGSGTADSSTYLRGDGTWATPSGGGSSMPRPNTTQFAMVLPSGSGTSLTTLRVYAVASGTASLQGASSTAPQTMNYATSATADASAYVIEGSGAYRYPAASLRFEAYAQIPAASDYSAARFFVGLSGATSGSYATLTTDPPTATTAMAGFFARAGTDTNWQCIHGNGSATDTYNSGVAVSTSGVKLTVAATAAGVEYYINGAQVCASISQTHIPSSATAMRMVFTHRTTEAVAKNFRLGWLYVEENY